MFCPNCGKQIPDVAAFCTGCGSPIRRVKAPNASAEEKQAAPPASSAAEIKKVQPRAEMPKAGQTVQEDRLPPKPLQDEPKQRSGWKRGYTYAVCLLVIALAVGAFLFLRDGGVLTGKAETSSASLERPKKEPGSGQKKTATDQPAAAPEPETTQNAPAAAPAPEEQIPEALPNPEGDYLDTRPIVDVEQTVQQIREQYNDTVSDLNAGLYRAVVTDGDIRAYYDGDSLRAIMVPRGSMGNTYAQSFYYQNDALYFAFYEGDDAHRLYFSDGYLIRWRYSQYATAPQDAVNHDQEQSDSFRTWEYTALEDSSRYQIIVSEAENAAAPGQYILPDSDTRRITNADLDRLSHQQCSLARNEIYARHGRKFKNPDLSAYFKQKTWYSATVDAAVFDANTASYLTELERANAEFILKYEKDVYGGSFY